MTTPSSPLRVILSATTAADAEASLALASALATEAGAELHGLLVEDEEVLALEASPSSCFVDPSGQAVAAPGRERLRMAFAREAARFERLLKEAAETASLQRSFSHRHGRLAAAVSGLASPGDLLIVPASPFRVPVREIVFLGGEAADPNLMFLAQTAAQRLLRPLRILSGPEATDTNLPSGSASRTPDLPQLHAALDRLGAGCVLFSSMRPAGLELEEILGRTRCTHVLRS